MANCAIVGINWGDEGKGRMVDYLTGQYDVVVRYQGGGNAGHTVINDMGKFALHLLSIGGGKIRITRIQNIQVEISGEYSTLIIRQKDTPGVLTHITRCLSNGNVNIAFMRLFRETKGGMAYSVVESDERIPDKILEEIRQNGSVYEVLLIQDQKVG